MLFLLFTKHPAWLVALQLGLWVLFLASALVFNDATYSEFFDNVYVCKHTYKQLLYREDAQQMCLPKYMQLSECLGALYTHPFNNTVFMNHQGGIVSSACTTQCRTHTHKWQLILCHLHLYSRAIPLPIHREGWHTNDQPSCYRVTRWMKASKYTTNCSNIK